MYPQVWADTLVLIGMFVLRVAVPIALTIALGKWLERKLNPREQAQEVKPQATARASNIIPLHCWDVKRCDPAMRAQCAAFKHPDLPCWLAIQAEGGKVREECFTCPFYKPNAMAA